MSEKEREVRTLHFRGSKNIEPYTNIKIRNVRVDYKLECLKIDTRIGQFHIYLSMADIHKTFEILEKAKEKKAENCINCKWDAPCAALDRTSCRGFERRKK